MARESQWIGAYATPALGALAAGDVDTVQYALECIEFYALQLGYVPEARRAEEPEEDVCP